MSESIYITVPAVPVAQPRQRHRIVAGASGSWVQNYTPTNSPANAFKATCRLKAKEMYDGPPLEGALCVSLLFVLPRPGRLRWKRSAMPRLWHDRKPDGDNLEKAVIDALTGILWRRDEQIAEMHRAKVYADADEAPCVQLIVEQCAAVLPTTAGDMRERQESLFGG